MEKSNNKGNAEMGNDLIDIIKEESEGNDLINSEKEETEGESLEDFNGNRGLSKSAKKE